MLRFLRALLLAATGFVGWFGRSVFEGLTKRSLAQEAADDHQAQASAKRAEASEKEERTHRATLETLAAQTLEATLALLEPPTSTIDEGAARQARDAERRARADASRAHDEARRDASRALAERKAAIKGLGKEGAPEISSSSFERTMDPEDTKSTLKAA